MNMILLVDHEDSFTYNIYHLFKALGQQVVVEHYLRLQKHHITNAEAVILGPGPHHPASAKTSIALAKILMLNAKPLLGICLGHQIIGLALRARIRHASYTGHGIVSSVQHTGTGIFRGLPMPAKFTRYHSLVLDRPLPPWIEEIAVDEHGDVAGIRVKLAPAWGVQFHPESLASDQGHVLAENFLVEAGLL